MVSTLTEVVSFENTFYRTRKAKRYKEKKRERRWDCFSVIIADFTEVTGWRSSSLFHTISVLTL